MTVKISPVFNDAQLDSSGNPATGYKLFTYTAGSSAKQTVYQDSGGLSQHTNPILLNSRGEPPAPIWLTSGGAYKFVFTAPADSDPPVSPIRTVDNISGVNDTTTTLDEWVNPGFTPTFASATSFTLAGDQTSTFNVGRRLKSTNSGGTVYSTISVSAFGALTTVTVVNDSGTLDSGLSAVSYGLQSAANPSVPLLVDTFPLRSGSADKTKKVRLEVDGLTTGTTRVLTVQDSDDTIVGRATTDTLTNKTLTSPVIDTAVTGTAIATQAQQETGSATNVLVTPGRQQFHASAAKGWGKINITGGADASYNITSVTDNGTGDAIVVWNVDFSSSEHVTTATPFVAAAAQAIRVSSLAAGQDNLICFTTTTGAAVDPTCYLVTAFGDQ